MKRRNLISGTAALLLLTACVGGRATLAETPSPSDLHFDRLAASWDEGLPLGNATVGQLVWQRDSTLRFSLDRVDLWDLRPMDSLSGPNYRFAWVREQAEKNDYLPVQKKFDHPYDAQAAPAKIPGAALEFSPSLGRAVAAHLYINEALAEVKWESGATLRTFVHATEPVGWFVFDHLPDSVDPAPVIVAPQYALPEGTPEGQSVPGNSLVRLGYPQGTVRRTANEAVYHQEGWGGFSYDVAVRWERTGDRLVGVWSVTSSTSPERAEAETADALSRGMEEDYGSHQDFWDNYWAQSSVTLPDSVLQKQYDNEMYKFGAAAREHSYPISLQAVWTADNGLLPPWKGDYHHDLNTELSYWPAYTGNHLTEGLGYLNTLWAQRDTYKRYTRQYFGTDGMNVPGVCTLTGEPMGGWIQYAMSPTVGAWLAHHFYLHWKYSADPEFLRDRAYPFLKDVAVYLEQISYVSDGVRRLPLSSSPEMFDNSRKAWFDDLTNFDLAQMRFAFSAAAEMASALGRSDEASHWRTIGAQLPDLDTDADGALTIAPGFPYAASHRHFSHAVAIHPLGLLDWSQGEAAQRTIRATVKKLKDNGPAWWCGYSYSWFACLAARAFDGEAAAQALRTFAECFCLPNTFHANGDQTASGKSNFTYRPFTLEGNFAFAAGVQEMLLQSHTGVVHVFPAIPAGWTDVAFRNLRAQGAFLVSATKSGGRLTQVQVRPEQGGTLRLALPADSKVKELRGATATDTADADILTLQTEKGKTVTLTFE